MLGLRGPLRKRAWRRTSLPAVPSKRGSNPPSKTSKHLSHTHISDSDSSRVCVLRPQCSLLEWTHLSPCVHVHNGVVSVWARVSECARVHKTAKLVMFKVFWGFTHAWSSLRTRLWTVSSPQSTNWCTDRGVTMRKKSWEKKSVRVTQKSVLLRNSQLYNRKKTKYEDACLQASNHSNQRLSQIVTWDCEK